MITLEDAKKSMNNEIERSKKSLEIGYGPEKHNWLEATPQNSFGKEENMVKLFVLEGTPPKGYILADYASGIVKSFRKLDLRTMKTYRSYKKGESLKPIEDTPDENEISDENETPDENEISDTSDEKLE